MFVLRFLILFLLVLSGTLAEAQYCGRDSGLTCPAPDEDGDGYTTDGTLDGYDCNDADWQQFPWVWRYSGGLYQLCGVNGVWSGGAAIPNGATGLGADYFIDCDAVTNGSGTHASPWNSLKQIATISGGGIPSGWHNLIPGDQVWIAGTCDEEIDHNSDGAGYNFNLYIDDSGTITNPIKFATWPGRARGHIKSNVYKDKIVQIEGGSQFLEFYGLEVSGLGDYGFSWSDSADLIARNLYIHDVDGIVNNNNTGFASSVTSTSTLSHSLLLNNYDRSTLTGGSTQNVRNAVYFQGTGNVFTRNVLKMTNAEILNAEYGAGVGYKHGDTVTTSGSTFEASYNVIIGSAWATESGQAGSHIHHNYAEFRDAFFYYNDVGGPFYPQNALVEYNTAKGPTLIKIESFSYDIAPDNNIFKRNILVSAVGAYNSEAGVVSDSTYGSDAEYALTSLIGVYDYQLNCYYNVGAALVFNHYNSSSGAQVLGGTYSFAQWQAVDVAGGNSKPAWDNDSFNENPILNGISRATSTNCDDMGYLAGLLGGGNALPTPTATPSASPSASSSATGTPTPANSPGVGATPAADFVKKNPWNIFNW